MLSIKMNQYTEQEKCFNTLFEATVKTNWDKPALSDYQGQTLSFADLAIQIERFHLLYKEIGIQQGDNIALCGRNCTNWAVAYFATITYGAVAVPILHEFKPEQIQNILNHSEARLLFAGDNIWKDFTTANLKILTSGFLGVINITDYSVLTQNNVSLKETLHSIDLIFNVKHPQGFTADDVDYVKQPGDSLTIINYTSGSTGTSKGVMLSQKNIWNNVQFAIDMLSEKIAPNGSIVSILPMAHMYGLAFEIMSEICMGMHIYFLTKLSPTIIFKAFAEIRPTVIISVPLILEKVIRRVVIPKFQDVRIHTLLQLPLVGRQIKKKICNKITEAFGGRFYEIVIGGAALAEDVEKIIHDIGFHYTIGYGATECAPLITYSHWYDFKRGSCGQPIDRMAIRIDSSDPTNIVGEILVKGDGVMLGYYKNEELTHATIDSDGWYHTGDLGIMDAEQYLFIRGRSKNMLLGPNGQNIYPEEIEDKLNARILVAESVVIQKNDKLYALIFPDTDEVENTAITSKDLPKELDKMRKELNQELPAYEQIAGIKIMPQEFEKTPKKSIKRFLYLNEEV